MLVGALALMLAGGTAAAQSQETNTTTTNTVGNPQLRDFELPGTRVTPPVAVPDTAPPPVTITPPPPPNPATPTPTSETPRPNPGAAVRPARRIAPAMRVDNRSVPTAAPDAGTTVTPLPAAPGLENLPALPAPSAPAAQAPPNPTPVPESAEGGMPWLYFGIAAGLALLVLFAFTKFRRRPEEEFDTLETETTETVVEPVPVAVRTPSAAPVARAPRSDIVGIQMRPILELHFKPTRAAATLTEANVQFELTVRNTGSAAARNVRIEVRIFNPGHEQEQEILAFYSEPIRERTSPALEALPPKEEVQLSSTVAMPNENVRELTVQGRRLFIPTIAFNVVYDYGNGKSGQTSTSYIVGREAETPTEKMGAFRLDLGPRLYRSVGQRPMKLARTV